MFSIGQDTSPIPCFSTLLHSTDGLSVTPRKNQLRIIFLGDRLIVNPLFSLTPIQIAQHSPAHINNLYNTTFWALIQQGGQTTTEAHATLRVCIIFSLLSLFFLSSSSFVPKFCTSFIPHCRAHFLKIRTRSFSPASTLTTIRFIPAFVRGAF